MMGFWCKGKNDYCNDTSCEACNACKYQNGSGGIELEDDDVKDIVIRRWISVDDRLPDTSRPVLVCTRNKYGVPKIAIAWCRSGEWSGSGGRWRNVTHWMPLPEPPKEEFSSKGEQVLAEMKRLGWYGTVEKRRRP